ncbi:MAG: neutral/alkaline non-lysosomal ceramidase N-terminal domain-containing protein [Planctomycetes bacterium]|nr:neutral/alkaline non-lysosomal ceramidase N-terminal domain-containing protein [Planctomycetota bacterium]MCH9726986.1 neutral/alkaline non-lysosomal ceramidase N-terminal domain-containing protein [Planctomycetota bacterium]MCH9775224.1 neutral/alkaline non-lysosomal ceramidase N-terminal domain-containing protein [Planctomycetota bacterium]
MLPSNLRYLSHSVLFFIMGIVFAIPGVTFAAGSSFSFGFAKTEITPEVPLRLSGYGNRAVVYEGVDEPIYIRAVAIKTPDQKICSLVSLDSIGFAGAFVDRISQQLKKQYGMSRDQLVICSTHSHTTPQPVEGLSNIFSTPMTDAEKQASQKYWDSVETRILQTIGKAIQDLRPGKMSIVTGKVSFAQNRRVLKNGKWTGFGVNPKGPVDHSLPLIRITDTSGELRGLLFNYACHCTTFGSDYNRLNGDWAGYAAKYIEEQHDDIVAICTIGCGADQNPIRGEKDVAKDLAIGHGRAIAVEVARLLKQPMQEVTEDLKTDFGVADLPFDRPSEMALKKSLESSRPQVKQHAKNMLAIYKENGQLPESYSAPVQVWKFGNQLTMIFLGGEVVVDYVLRLKKEIKSDSVWVTAYANDIFGYVASERMRDEGGYEYDFSMIYYNQPGPWDKGTEELLMRRIHELVKQAR